MQNPVESSVSGRAEAPPSSPASLAVASSAESKAAPTTAEMAAGEACLVPEIGGPSGPEPTRFGDWEKKGRCIDF